MPSRAETREAVAAELDRRDKRWRAAAIVANVLLDDETIMVNSLDVRASQVNGIGDFMAYVQIDATLGHDRLAHLAELAGIYGFETVVLSRHDGEGHYNLRIWPKGE